jgi:hypothetical protein
MALSLSEGFQSFKKGLDKTLIWAYWHAVREEAWAILWGAGLIGIPVTIATLYFSPSWKALGWTLAWCVLVAGIPRCSCRATIRRKIQEVRSFCGCRSKPIPWIGGVIGASASLTAERDQEGVNDLHRLWLKEHEHKVHDRSDTE